MAGKLHKTKGIVLRTVKYGETSVVVTIYTELFGLQSYLVNGVRTQTKKGTGKAMMFQPSAILDLVVYHNEHSHLHRIREFHWHVIYERLLSDVIRHSIALFMIELLTRCLKQPESNPDLYFFVEDALLHLDQCDASSAANFPLFFALHLPVFLGFRIDDNYSENNSYLDMLEGVFTREVPSHPNFLEDKAAFVTSQILKAQHPADLAELQLHSHFRRQLLFAYEKYYALHVQDFGVMKTLNILKEIV